jgi:hypothetical protein
MLAFGSFLYRRVTQDEIDLFHGLVVFRYFWFEFLLTVGVEEFIDICF